MTTVVVITFVGAVMLALGIWSLRTRAYDNSISAIEAVILKVSREKPLPLSSGDRAWGRAQAWLMIVFGGLALGLSALIIISSFVSE